MRWGIYAIGNFEGAEAFRLGLLEIGCEGYERCAWDYNDNCLEPFDAIALFGLHGKGQRIRKEYRAAGIPVVMIDYGYLKRTNHAHDWRTGHWQVGIDKLNSLPDFDCPSDRFDALGLEIIERGGDPGGYPLLCVQTPNDQSHGKSEDELGEWCRAQAERWPGLLIRPHPLRAELDYGLPRCPATTLQDALAGARVVITGNSNTGHDALLAGVPAIATFPGAAWDELSGEDIPSVERRRAYFHRAAYGQWTWSEFRTGEPQRFVIDRLLPRR